MPAVKPAKPYYPEKYMYIDRTDVNIKGYGDNGGWDMISYNEIDLIDAKEGKSYGVLGTRNNAKASDGSELVGGGAMLGVTANWDSRNPTDIEKCSPKFLVLTVAPKTHDGTQTAGKIFKGYAKAYAWSDVDLLAPSMPTAATDINDSVLNPLTGSASLSAFGALLMFSLYSERLTKSSSEMPIYKAVSVVGGVFR